MQGLGGWRRGCHHAQHAARSPGETPAPRTPLPASPVFPAGRRSMQPDGEESGRCNWEVSDPGDGEQGLEGATELTDNSCNCKVLGATTFEDIMKKPDA